MHRIRLCPSPPHIHCGNSQHQIMEVGPCSLFILVHVHSHPQELEIVSVHTYKKYSHCLRPFHILWQCEFNVQWPIPGLV